MLMLEDDNDDSNVVQSMARCAYPFFILLLMIRRAGNCHRRGGIPLKTSGVKHTLREFVLSSCAQDAYKHSSTLFSNCFTAQFCSVSFRCSTNQTRLLLQMLMRLSCIGNGRKAKERRRSMKTLFGKTDGLLNCIFSM